MVNSDMLLSLYTSVLEYTSFDNNVSENDVKRAIEQMHEVYKGSPDSLNKTLNGLSDFNEVAYRCAYLFKYAPFHTALTYKAMSHALTESRYELQALLNSLSGPLKVCSLGGGPGADVIGVLAAMHNQYGFFRSSVKLVDIMSEWESTFWSILDELKQQNYGPLTESMSEKWFDWSFITADLQDELSEELTGVLKTADVVTMIKFVSAAASKKTSNMIDKIFKIMKPGAFLFFVDNAGGGFKRIIDNSARKYKFKDVSTPLSHQPYTNEYFKNIRYGYKSCYEVKVAVQLLMKSGPINYSNQGNLMTNWSSKKSFLSSPFSHWEKFQNFRVGPKPVDLMNETFESPSNRHGSNFSSEFSPRLNRLKAQIDSPASLNESIESQPFWSSTPRVLASQNWPASSPPSFWQKMHVPKIQNFRIRSKRVDNFAVGQMYNSKNSPWCTQTLDESGLNTTEAHDSGFADDSFDNELSWDSPAYNSSSHLKASQRLDGFRIPKRKTDLSFNENDLFWNTPKNNLPQHSKPMPYGKYSLAPIPYRQNLEQLEQSPLHQPWSSNRHPFGILKHSERYHCEPERPQIRHSRTVLLSLPQPHQFPSKYKAPRPRKVLMHQHKPFERKRSRTK